MKETGFHITVLGTRGSMAVSGPRYHLYGGATSCYHVQAGEENLFLDAGSGLIQAPTRFSRTPVILLTHLHLDHLLGLGMYPRLSMRGEETRILFPVAPGQDPRQVLERLYSPPFWPLSLAGYAGNVRFEPLTFPLTVGEVVVEGIPGNHPGDSWILKLSWQGKSLVYATDYEYEPASFAALTELARGADLLMYDGQYTAEEAETKRGFGHSTEELGLALMKAGNVKRLLLVHHDPQSTDDVLKAREASLPDERAGYAKAGEVIEL